MKKTWTLNSSNQGKLHEFEQLFAKHGITLFSSTQDLKEIQADPITVVVHKASQMGEEILVEDTSLDIEGEEVGINVRWLLDHLPAFVGRKARWRALLAYLKKGSVYVYEGVVDGVIVPPRGKGGFGFDPVFLPNTSEQTLAEAKPSHVNARAKVVEALLQDKPIAVVPPIKRWDGPWQ